MHVPLTGCGGRVNPGNDIKGLPRLTRREKQKQEEGKGTEKAKIKSLGGDYERIQLACANHNEGEKVREQDEKKSGASGKRRDVLMSRRSKVTREEGNSRGRGQGSSLLRGAFGQRETAHQFRDHARLQKAGKKKDEKQHSRRGFGDRRQAPVVIDFRKVNVLITRTRRNMGRCERS